MRFNAPPQICRSAVSRRHTDVDCRTIAAAVHRHDTRINSIRRQHPRIGFDIGGGAIQFAARNAVAGSHFARQIIAVAQQTFSFVEVAPCHCPADAAGGNHFIIQHQFRHRGKSEITLGGIFAQQFYVAHTPAAETPL